MEDMKMLYDMSEVDKKWLKAEISSSLRPVLEELKAIRKLLEDKKKQEASELTNFAYAFAHSQAGITPDEQAQAARRAEATTLYDGAAVEKEEKSGSDEVIGSSKTG
jgi:hypothetical protein